MNLHKKILFVSLLVILAGCDPTQTVNFNYQAPVVEKPAKKNNLPLGIGPVTDDRSQFNEYMLGILYPKNPDNRTPYIFEKSLSDLVEEGLYNYLMANNYQLANQLTNITLTGKIYDLDFYTKYVSFTRRNLVVRIAGIFSITDNKTGKLLWTQNVAGSNNPATTVFNRFNSSLPSNDTVVKAINEALTNLFQQIEDSPGFAKAIGLSTH